MSHQKEIHKAYKKYLWMKPANTPSCFNVIHCCIIMKNHFFFYKFQFNSSSRYTESTSCSLIFQVQTRFWKIKEFCFWRRRNVVQWKRFLLNIATELLLWIQDLWTCFLVVIIMNHSDVIANVDATYLKFLFHRYWSVAQSVVKKG